MSVAIYRRHWALFEHSVPVEGQQRNPLEKYKISLAYSILDICSLGHARQTMAVNQA
jgi:hypothetical protein